MMGFEIELDRGVTDFHDGKIPGDEKLATFGDASFSLVTDARRAGRTEGRGAKQLKYSNIELVTAPFDQLAVPDPVPPLIASMRGVAEALYKVRGDNVEKLGNLLQKLQKSTGLKYSLTEWGTVTLVRGPEIDVLAEGGQFSTYDTSDSGADSLFAHYTIGFPIDQLSPALTWAREHARSQNNSQLNAQRAERVATMAGELFAGWARHRGHDVAQTEIDTLAGYVKLVFTQVAAIIDKLDGEDGLTKNKTIVLCRVPLREVAKVLPRHSREFLAEQAWADLLTEYEVADLDAFIKAQVYDAQARLTAKEAAAVKEFTRLDALIAKQQAVPGAHQPDSDAGRYLASLQKDRADVAADISNARTALLEWQQLPTSLPTFATLDAERTKGVFAWSIIEGAIIPALEGKTLTARPGQLPTFGPATDGGSKHDLPTENTCNSVTDEANDLATKVTMGQYLRSALLSPGVPTIWQEKVFGGMKQIPAPEPWRETYLVPLELRCHGNPKITWAELAQTAREITQFSANFLPRLTTTTTTTTNTDTTMMEGDASGTGTTPKRERDDVLADDDPERKKRTRTVGETTTTTTTPAAPDTTEKFT
jgi:hypothetical protein